MAKVGFIGLGNIGKGICKNLIEKGNEVTVFDVSAEAMKRFEGKAKLAADELDVLHSSDYIFFSLPNSNIVEGIVDKFLSDGIEGKMIIDTSTCYPLSTKALQKKIAAAGGAMVDAPLMAGPAEAEAGILDIVVGGSEEDFQRCSPLFDCYCRSYKHVGPIGSGHLAKLAINFCGLTEALMFAQLFPVMEKLGMGEEQLYDILNCESLDNWVFRFYCDKYVNSLYNRLDFALALGTKDLSYMKRLYEDLNVPAFILDGSLNLCRFALKDQQPGEILDFSYPYKAMRDLLKLDK